MDQGILLLTPEFADARAPRCVRSVRSVAVCRAVWLSPLDVAFVTRACNLIGGCWRPELKAVAGVQLVLGVAFAEAQVSLEHPDLQVDEGVVVLCMNVTAGIGILEKAAPI